MRPIIGITGNIEIKQGPIFPGLKISYTSNDYVEAVDAAGGAPSVLPLTKSEDAIAAHAHNIDGLLLTGGPDVNPLLYGQEPENGLGRIFPEKDAFEIALFNAVNDLGKPVLAICRGLQIVNVALGGTLYQDMKAEDGFHIKHAQQAQPHVASHTVRFAKDSYFADVFGEKTLTNTLHHQAIKDLGKGIRVSGNAEDGTIEAMETDNVIGVQWHPEFMAAHDPKMLQLFSDFVERAKKN